jgi:hypothetical protein
MDLTFLAAAAEHHESKDATAFYVIGGLFALFAVIVGVAGIKKPVWEEGPARAVLGVGAVFTAATMVAAIVTT